MDSDVDDTFTIILQYSGKQKNLVVTVKTAIVTHMKDQLKFFVRGSKGTYLKVGDQLHTAAQARSGMLTTVDSSVWDLPAGEPGNCGAGAAGN